MELGCSNLTRDITTPDPNDLLTKFLFNGILILVTNFIKGRYISDRVWSLFQEETLEVIPFGYRAIMNRTLKT